MDDQVVPPGLLQFLHELEIGYGALTKLRIGKGGDVFIADVVLSLEEGSGLRDLIVGHGNVLQGLPKPRPQRHQLVVLLRRLPDPGGYRLICLRLLHQRHQLLGLPALRAQVEAAEQAVAFPAPRSVPDRLAEPREALPGEGLVAHPLGSASIPLQMLTLAEALVLNLLRVRQLVIQCELKPQDKVRSNILLVRIVHLRQPVSQLDRHVPDVVQLRTSIRVAEVSSCEDGLLRDPRLLLLSQALVVLCLVEEHEPYSVILED